ncbi:deoxyguanosinetriphosphate triphosphohydrolase [Clostridium sporogenes]|uniref:Deoxyguanosinetriphosphate triphosphohydrolase n=1 Tax=Clostridium botulinum TaxID=1491 RepID=A0A6M0SZ09_CLOBO|nr:deoxyguanosinetriphosphate triphosphohydrolase [Clostridium sporogenes]NFA60504.1 deoxyguanosinetriphosphate triphosphohydrolase [Clostridium botulinum]NFI73906.1 deoxyguanosinetriphosphate triphosphohydrolase [Clostridium sporogenes]NFL71718.1 deoxyguanosinetriphosphate triphosphohydrolase [Clostridium sporogenes]NFM23757.1 deoxyguanosinetriphosphate triphosphohydrolase [Clostridium sporogenes]NFP61780.1 deoxyguanosinetriphosphate triphosphohydrolase [Clostridium sporogenes]
MNIRESIEKKEKLILNEKACFSINSKGRKTSEPKDDIRTVFMIDRDRIIHSKSFRRLKHKTQVYIRTSGDHYRTRLTHTLEVAQIAKTIGKGIGLNEDLIEAIALGHDIGHVAFAHNGEEVLNELLPYGFKHNENSVRVLKKIEKEGRGLNLTKEVLDGILYHSGFSKKSHKAHTLEGQVVKYSDKIAYVNHDIDDSIRAGLLFQKDIPKDLLYCLGNTHGERINILVIDCIKNTLNNIEKGLIEVSLSDEKESALYELRKYLFKKIYNGKILKTEREKAKFVLKQVFDYFVKNPEKMPKLYKSIAKEEGLYVGVADYIAGMSDDYCLHLFNSIYVPKVVIY